MYRAFLFLAFGWGIARGQGQNNRPIIGILSQALDFDHDYLSPGGTYIGASYIKWVEAAGARAVPLIAGSSQNFTELFQQINGVLIPGGAVSLETSPYSRLGKLMFDLAKAENDAGGYFPIWGSCLGFELLAFLAANEQRNLKSCWSQDQAAPLYFLEGWDESRLFSQANAEVVDALSNENVTINFHRWCLTMDNFTKFGMEEFWNPLSVNLDLNGLEFISSMEAKNYPFYATQFHPEKISFEWTEIWDHIPHSREAILANGYLADFFVGEARKNNHTFISREVEEQHLIYNFAPVYTGSQSVNWTFQQAYIFPREQQQFP